MKVTELRINNLVNYGVNVVPIKSIHTESFLKNEVSVYVELNEKLSNYCLNIDEITPIPLTEEWLLKFGFEKEVDRIDIFTKQRLRIWKGYNGKSLCYLVDEDNENGYYLKDIEYIHQLQNLFYALTEEELSYDKQKLRS